MKVEKLEIHNFRNILSEDFEFHPKVNIITGKNGSGKTSLLDCIHYLCLTKSFLYGIDYENINKNADFFSIRGIIEKENIKYSILLSFSKNDGKLLKVNEKVKNKLHDYIGTFLVVVFSFSDINLVFDGSEYRRKVLDAYLSQIDKDYLVSLINYNKLLKQRNALLKNSQYDQTLFDSIDEKMCQLANIIYDKRKNFIVKLEEGIKKIYSEIEKEKNIEISLQYKSHLEINNLQTLLNENIKTDLETKTTNFGIHKDDIIIRFNDKKLKFASQGEIRFFLFAFKFSILSFFYETFNSYPIILVDDFPDKFDIYKLSNILGYMKNFNSQFFYSVPKNLEILEKIKSFFNDYKIIEIDEGKKI